MVTTQPSTLNQQPLCGGASISVAEFTVALTETQTEKEMWPYMTLKEYEAMWVRLEEQMRTELGEEAWEEFEKENQSSSGESK